MIAKLIRLLYIAVENINYSKCEVILRRSGQIY